LSMSYLDVGKKSEPYALPVPANAPHSVGSDNLPIEEWSRLTDPE